jgi:hypothetical protein
MLARSGRLAPRSQTARMGAKLPYASRERTSAIAVCPRNSRSAFHQIADVQRLMAPVGPEAVAQLEYRISG